jgi:hypothetical protein
MLLGSNQQLNGLFLRLQYMTQSVPLPPERAEAYATRADDFALFVRALLGLSMVACGSTGTFQHSALLDSIPFLKTAMASRRNGVALLFIAWCFVTDTLRAVFPPALILVLLLMVVDMLQVFASIEVADVLLKDSSLTNFACAVLVLCDAACVVYASVGRIARKLRGMSALSVQRGKDNRTALSSTTHADLEQRANFLTQELHFSGDHVNVDNIKMRVFEKKSN